MNRLNRKVEYALMALKFLSKKRPGELTSAKDLAEALKIPFDATARVLQQMAHGGLLQVEQGSLGGYGIQRNLTKVSFHELVEVVEGPTGIAKCLHTEGLAACELSNTCNIQSPVANLNRKLTEFYQGLSVAELFRIKDPNPQERERTA